MYTKTGELVRCVVSEIKQDEFSRHDVDGGDDEEDDDGDDDDA